MGPGDDPLALHCGWKLLHNDAGTLSLLANNTFPGKPPRYIRALLYRYHFAPPGNETGAWWERKLIGEWIPPLSTESPIWEQTREVYGWPREESGK